MRHWCCWQTMVSRGLYAACASVPPYTSPLRRVVDDGWASWSLPGVVCFGDSGTPTFLFNSARNRAGEEIVAVASDGGDVCFSRDDRSRVDTQSAHDWVRKTIAESTRKR